MFQKQKLVGFTEGLRDSMKKMSQEEAQDFFFSLNNRKNRNVIYGSKEAWGKTRFWFGTVAFEQPTSLPTEANP